MDVTSHPVHHTGKPEQLRQLKTAAPSVQEGVRQGLEQHPEDSERQRFLMGPARDEPPDQVINWVMELLVSLKYVNRASASCSGDEGARTEGKLSMN